MEHVTLHDELKLPCPDGFHVMDEAERARFHFSVKDSGACLSDPERHMLVSAAWTQFSGLTTLLLSDRDLAKRTERDIRKSMQGFGYQLGAFLHRNVGGRIAEGFCYTYTAQRTAMYGESCVLKSGKALFNFHLYARDALKAESLPVWETLLSDAQWIC